MASWVRQIVIFLLIGAVINVAVAWTLAITINPWETPDADQLMGCRRVKHDVRWHVDYWSGRGFVIFSSLFMRDTTNPSRDDYGIDPRDHVPAWSGLTVPSHEFEDGAYAAEWQTGVARGWPMMSLWHMCEHYAAPPGTYLPPRGAIEVPLTWKHRYRTVGIKDEARMLPYWIVPHGFTINTIFYAAIAWMLLAIPRYARWRWRARRGRCAKCNYDLRSSGIKHEACPECGAAVRDRRIRNPVVTTCG